MTALNPVLSVGAQIVENLVAHTDLDARRGAIGRWNCLTLVGIPAAAQRVRLST